MRSRSSNSIPPGLIKWIAVIIIIVFIFGWIQSMWEKIMSSGFNGIILILGILVLILGGSVILGKKIRIKK